MWLVGTRTSQARSRGRRGGERTGWVRFWSCSSRKPSSALPSAFPWNPALSSVLREGNSEEICKAVSFGRFPLSLGRKIRSWSGRRAFCGCLLLETNRREGASFVQMEKESKEQRGAPLRAAPPEPDFPLQWGSRKRLRCVKVRDEGSPAKSDGRRRATSRINRRVVTGGDKDFPTPRFHRPAQLPHR